MAIILWNKKYTETLAETLKRFRLEKPEYDNEKVTYAGRLDPMAEGLLILLTGDDVHRKNEFLGLDKTYEVFFVFGVKTDTYDILGIPTWVSDESINLDILKKNIIDLENISEQQYPVYSSKPVQGKPLFVWAREDALSTIEIPTRTVLISKTEYVSSIEMTKEHLKKHIYKAIHSVVGDFRQDNIIKKWEQYFEKTDKSSYQIYKMRVACSSGTYIRTLVNTLASVHGIGACSLRIRRIQVGEYFLSDISN